MAFESNQMHLNQMQVQMQMSTIQMQVKMQMRPPRGIQMQVQMQMPHLHLQVQMHLHLNTSLLYIQLRWLLLWYEAAQMDVETYLARFSEPHFITEDAAMTPMVAFHQPVDPSQLVISQLYT